MQKKAFRQSLYVLILSSLVSMLGALVDGMIIGRLMGSVAMTAYGFVIPVTVVAAGIAGIVASGSQSLSGKALAKGDTIGAESYLSTALLGYGLLGCLLAFTIIFFSSQLCVLLGVDSSDIYVMNAAKYYMIGFAVGFPGIIFTQILSAFMHLENVKRRALIAAAIGTAVNIVGDIANVLVFNGGMFGMGLTTTISYYVMVIILLKRFIEPGRVMSVKPKRFSLGKLRELTILGLPSADIQLCSTVRTIFLNRLILIISSQVAVCAFSIRMSMYNLYGAVVIGFGLTTLLVSSFYIGEENPEAIGRVLKVALHDGIIVMCVLTVLVCGAARPLVEMFSTDETVIEMAIASVRYFALSLPVFVVNSIFAKYYQALGKHVLSHAITILENLIYVCGIAFVLSDELSLTGIWISFLGSEIMTLLTIVIIVGIKNKKIPASINDFMLLPENFGPEAGNQFYVECESIQDVQSANDRLWDFLNRSQASKEVRVKLAICAEELMKNVFTQSDAISKRQLDLWLVESPQEWKLCLRDNGGAFNPINWLKVNDDKDDCYGLRLVQMAAEDIKYIYTLNMNQIIIRVSKDKLKESK